MNRVAGLVVMGVVASTAMATVPNPEVWYACDRDTGLYGWSSVVWHVNTGFRDYLRVGKFGETSGEQVIVDWDMAGEIQPAIDAELTMWGKTLGEAMALDMVSVGYQIGGATDWPDKVVNLKTVLAVNDWSEGDGWDWNTNYDWTTPYGATWAYAGDTVPFSDNALHWQSPGGSNTTFENLDGTYNSTQIIGFAESPDAQNIMWSGTDLDEALWSELIYEDNCVGLRQFGDGYSGGFDPPKPVGYDNVLMLAREHWGDDGDPSLVIQVKPHDGDAQPDGFVDLLDLTIVANNWELNAGLNEWEQADFNSDGNVDLLDLTLLANEWEWQASGGAAAVPEPASLMVLCVGALGLIRRRR